jgi:transcriptional regulator with XRE-family HTH domain
MSGIVEPEELGRRIRKLRLDRRMTLKQVEQASGLSATHLSEIERGRTSPTVGALVRIARALDRDPSYFVEDEERPEVVHLLREDTKLFTLADGVTAQRLTCGIPGSSVFAYRLQLRATPPAAFVLPAEDVPGDAVYYVRRGRLELRVGERSLALVPGDAAQASFSQLHRFDAHGGEDAEVIAVMTRALCEPC